MTFFDGIRQFVTFGLWSNSKSWNRLGVSLVDAVKNRKEVNMDTGITEVEKAQLLDALRTSMLSDLRVTKVAFDLCRRLCSSHDALVSAMEKIASIPLEDCPPEIYGIATSSIASTKKKTN